jgi:hypothetical protein
MPDEPLALSPIARPRPAAETEYQAICQAVMETERGRWFLSEYARRSRSDDTRLLLEAIARIETRLRGEAPPQSLDRFVAALTEMAQAIARMKSDIAAITPSGDHSGFDATDTDLDAILAASERATSDIHAATERIQELAWSMREQGLDQRLCDVLDASAQDIHAACAFQDLSDRRSEKVIRALRYIEGRLSALGDVWGVVAGAPQAEMSGAPGGAGARADTADDLCGEEPSPVEAPAEAVPESASDVDEEEPPASDCGLVLPDAEAVETSAYALAASATPDEPAFEIADTEAAWDEVGVERTPHTQGTAAHSDRPAADDTDEDKMRAEGEPAASVGLHQEEVVSEADHLPNLIFSLPESADEPLPEPAASPVDAVHEVASVTAEMAAAPEAEEAGLDETFAGPAPASEHPAPERERADWLFGPGPAIVETLVIPEETLIERPVTVLSAPISRAESEAAGPGEGIGPAEAAPMEDDPESAETLPGYAAEHLPAREPLPRPVNDLADFAIEPEPVVSAWSSMAALAEPAIGPSPVVLLRSEGVGHRQPAEPPLPPIDFDLQPAFAARHPTADASRGAAERPISVLGPMPSQAVFEPSAAPAPATEATHAPEPLAGAVLPVPADASTAAAEEDGTPPPRMDAPEAASRSRPRSAEPHDLLAAIVGLTDEEKIALFG